MHIKVYLRAKRLLSLTCSHRHTKKSNFLHVKTENSRQLDACQFMYEITVNQLSLNNVLGDLWSGDKWDKMPNYSNKLELRDSLWSFPLWAESSWKLCCWQPVNKLPPSGHKLLLLLLSSHQFQPNNQYFITNNNLNRRRSKKYKRV